MRRPLTFVTACFFFSGLSALVYEVVWARQLGWFLGTTTHAHTVVISAYLGGLAAGSVYFGHSADRGLHPFRAYAWIEAGVGLYAATTPWLFPLLQRAYTGVSDSAQLGDASGYGIRFAIALVALLVPTFLMGGTLPLLVRGLARHLPTLGVTTSRLYGINTLGATLGALLAGFVLLPLGGVRVSIFFATAINLAIAALVLRACRELPAGATWRRSPTAPEPASSHEARVPTRYILLTAFGIAGFAALLTQMAWIRAMILVVGGSIYAFSITLAVFLGGIGIGSLLLPRLPAVSAPLRENTSLQPRLKLASALALFISATLLLGLPLIGKMPEWLLAAFAAGLHGSFPALQLFIFALAIALMFLPTLGMGALFPLIASVCTRGIEAAGRGIGVAYAVNTAGTILGALLGGLLIIPWIGIHRSIQLAAALYFLAAATFWLLHRDSMPLTSRVAPVLTAALFFGTVAWLLPPWNPALMVSGVFQAPSVALEATREGTLAEVVEQFDLLYYREGRDGTVAVRRNGPQRSLLINGKADASSEKDLPTQVMLAQLPLALDREPKSALVIGLGSGITAGSLAASPQLERLRIIEISEEVVEASEFFRAENHGVLDDPRTEIVTADARNFLMTSPDRYDLIVSEPSNPWLSGVSGLFTREFLEIAKSRLNPGGVMTQWFHTYGMANPDLRTLLKTFAGQFRYVSVFAPMQEDIILIGSDTPHAIGPVLEPALGRELARAGLRNDRDLVRLFLIGGDELTRYVQHAAVNSDDRPRLEFNAPRHLYTVSSEQNLSDIARFLQGRSQVVPVARAVGHSNDYLNVHFMRLGIAMNGRFNPTAVQPVWTVTQRLVEAHGHGTRRLTESARALTWEEGLERFRVTAEWRPAPLAPTALETLVRDMAAVPGREAGLLRIKGSHGAAGMVSQNIDGDGVLLVITGQCPAQPDGVTHLVFRAELEDPGREGWAELLERQAERLDCT